MRPRGILKPNPPVAGYITESAICVLGNIIDKGGDVVLRR